MALWLVQVYREPSTALLSALFEVHRALSKPIISQVELLFDISLH